MPLTPLPPVRPDASLDELLALARSRYGVRFEPLTVNGVTLEFLQIENMDAYVEELTRDLPEDTPPELPFWAKIWRTALLVAYFTQRLEPAGRTMLEIGAGVGVCGLFAAARGFRVTVTDANPEAVLFTRIAVLRNNLADRVDVRRLDFTKDRLDERFDIILGSEVLYKEDQSRALVKFLAAHLRNDPAAEIILAKEYTRKAKKFFKLIEKDYAHQHLSIGYQGGSSAGDKAAGACGATGPGGGDRHLTTIHRIKPKRHAQA